MRKPYHSDCQRFTEAQHAIDESEHQWASEEYWIETMVQLCRDRGDHGAERYLRERLQNSRLHHEFALREAAVQLLR